jgi:transposase
VITMEMYGKLRRMYLRDKLSLHEIARRTGLSRNTVKKWIKKEDVKPPKYRRLVEAHKLTPFHKRLEQALQTDAHRPKRDRRTGRMLYEEVKASGYEGGYSRVTDFIRAWRRCHGKGVVKAFVPLQFALGEAFQFDWSEEGVVIGGIYHRLQVAHMKLCASRAFFLVAYFSQGHEMLFDAHTRSFTVLGGIPRRGIYDNMKTAVDRVKKGKHRIVNTRFAVMCGHYLFDADFCNVASGWEKGIVEKNVQDSRRRIFREASERRFSTLAEFNVWLSEQCQTLWKALKHPEYSSLTVFDVLEQERLAMMPMPKPFDGYVESLGQVSSTCLVAAKRNHYSAPCELAGQMVTVRLYPHEVVIVSNEVIVARHERCEGRGHTRYDWQHYLSLLERKPGALRNGAPFADLPSSLQRLRQTLLRQEGGDRVMAQVLAAVPTYGLEAVLVAVELVLESGAINAQHMINVLSRLKVSEPIPTIETDLHVQEMPLADTSRYDRLRVIDRIEEADHA